MDRPFRVLIAGGGVAGLTLANMLERFDVDYLLLESHGDIAPEVGASIGMFPNGLRILDQIDCYEPLRAFIDPYKVMYYTRDKTGNPVVSTPNFLQHVESRHGYPLAFFDRQWLLQSLYDNLHHKNRVLLGKGVAKIDLVDGGVQVSTIDGDKFRGSLIVGTDGVHSTVRKEMYRIGDALDPGYFPAVEENSFPCYYMCSFGIAQNVPGWTPGDQCSVLGNGHSQLILSGPENRVYWFFFSMLPEVKRGKDIPSCTEEMEAEFVQKYGQTIITPKVTFGQVYAKRLSSTLTPLHEYVCKKWVFNRIIILVDSAHKPNPVGGQGGNGAIEDVAGLVNALLKKKDDRGFLDGLTDQDITDIFMEVQTKRHERAESIVSVSHLQQSLAAYEKPFLSSLFFEYLMPMKGNEALLTLFGLAITRSERLDKLAVKRRPRAILYDDELPALPLRIVRPVQLVFAGLLGYAFFVATQVLPRPGSGFNIWGGMGTYLGSTYPPVLLADIPETALHGFYSSSQLIAPILIYTVEGYRLGNFGTVLALPSLFLTAMQLEGLGRVAPIYAILRIFLGHDLSTGRFVRPEVASALLPALTLGYALPTALMPSSTSVMRTVSHFAPLFVCVFTYVFARHWKSGGDTEREKEEADFDRYNPKDVSTLKLTYSYAFAVQAAAHLTILLYLHYHEDIDIAHMFFGVAGPFQLGFVSDIGSLSALARYDLAIAAAAWVLDGLYSIWSLRSLGYIKTSHVFRAALGFLAGQILVGPGAAWVGLWYWREDVLSSLRIE